MTKNVGIFLFDDVEVLDFAGPFEVFSTASRMKAGMQPDSPILFNVFSVAQVLRKVFARGGLQVIPDEDFASHPPIDILIVPGGIVNDELQKEPVIQWIRKVGQQEAELVASICTGAFLLAKSGFLDEKSATTHWEDIAGLRTMFPLVEVKEDVRWVDEDSVITSAGISAGIDMSLHLVARLESEELAAKTARQMEFYRHE